jgi:hypothetical protein
LPEELVGKNCPTTIHKTSTVKHPNNVPQKLKKFGHACGLKWTSAHVSNFVEALKWPMAHVLDVVVTIAERKHLKTTDNIRSHTESISITKNTMI